MTKLVSRLTKVDTDDRTKATRSSSILVSVVTAKPETELNCPTVYENNYLHLQRQDFAFHIKVTCWD